MPASSFHSFFPNWNCKRSCDWIVGVWRRVQKEEKTRCELWCWWYAIKGIQKSKRMPPCLNRFWRVTLICIFIWIYPFQSTSCSCCSHYIHLTLNNSHYNNIWCLKTRIKPPKTTNSILMTFFSSLTSHRCKYDWLVSFRSELISRE